MPRKHVVNKLPYLTGIQANSTTEVALPSVYHSLLKQVSVNYNFILHRCPVVATAVTILKIKD